MSAEMLAVLVPVVLAILGGETVVAYNHPKEFQKLFNVVCATLLTIVVAMAIWDISNIQAEMTLSYDDFKDLTTITRARTAIETKQFGLPYFGTVTAMWIYNIFLSNLPSWLKKEEKG